MASPGPDEREDREIFLAAVADARPLSDRDRAPAPRPPRRVWVDDLPERQLVVEWRGDRVTARAPGVSRRQVNDLRTAAAPEATLDLHRRRLTEARRLLEQSVADTLAAGRRRLLVITGKGRHSEGSPVLREAVVDWLAGPLAGHILAFTTAADHHGGAGAICVYLRRA